MKFVARFKHSRTQEDVSYHSAELGEPTIFPQAVDKLYFVVSRLSLTRIGPTLRGEVMRAEEAEEELGRLRMSADWVEVDEDGH